MKNLKIIGTFFLFVAGLSLYSQQIKVFNYEEFKPFLEKQTDTTYVINFWATWCIPCVKELPEFEEINAEYKTEKFKMLLVSLDFKSQIQNSLIPFINEKNLQAEVIVLSDPNSNVWINKINKSWSGAIPATIIYNKDFYFFHEGSMTKKDLKKILNKNIKR
ncbi:MAG: hypothetical protein C0595_01455 [Marinilabiliales bacterium]|nr:MAG: hypothetical protein C0595_01455 [Marinilabiliales bacterium]